MSNHTPNITQTSTKINGKLHSSKIWDGEISLNFTHCLKCENVYFSDENILLDNSLAIYNLQFYLINNISESP